MGLLLARVAKVVPDATVKYVVCNSQYSSGRISGSRMEASAPVSMSSITDMSLPYLRGEKMYSMYGLTARFFETMV